MVKNEVWGSAFALFVVEIVFIVHVLPLHLSSPIYNCLALLFSFFNFLLTPFSISPIFSLSFLPSHLLLYVTIRLFLFSITPFSFIFFDQHCKSQNKVDLECYYEPISKCTIHDALKNEHGDQRPLKDIYFVGFIEAEDMEKLRKDHESKKCFFFMCMSSTNSCPFKITCFEICCLLIFLSRIDLFVLWHVLALHSMHVDGTLKSIGIISIRIFVFFFSIEKTHIFFLLLAF
jgi:hypothetical protein